MDTKPKQPEPKQPDEGAAQDKMPHATHGIPHGARDDVPKGTPSDRHETETAATDE
jgi:hypothetical protein